MREELEAGQAAGLDGAAQEVLIEVVARRVVGGEERDDHGVQAGCGLELDVEGAVFARRAPVSQSNSFSRSPSSRNSIFSPGISPNGLVFAHVALADGRDLDGVFAIGGKLMLHDHAAASPERHAFDVIVLRGVFRARGRASETAAMHVANAPGG